MGLSEIKKKKSWKHWWVEVKNLKGVEYLTTFQLHKSLLIISLAPRNPKYQLKKNGIQRAECATSGTPVYA